MSKTNSTKPKVAIFSGPEGHLSIAKAAQDLLKDSAETDVTVVRDGIFNLYTPVYQFMPMAFKVPYMLTTPAPVRKSITAAFKRKYRPTINRVLTEFKPDITVSTHFMYFPGLEQAKEQQGLPFINIVPDPRTIHPLHISEKANTNIVFDSAANINLSEIAPTAHATTQGWFVRTDFKPVANPKPIRKKLGLDPEIFTIVFSSGSEGTVAILNLIPSLWQLPIACQCIVLCGNNKRLLRTVKAINNLVKRANPQVNLHPVGYTHRVHDYYAAADFVAGKAGPNTVFEAIACHKPFLVLTHIHGQEDGNLDIIRQHRLGWVEENIIHATRLITDLAAHPAKIEALESGVVAMAHYNRQAGESFVKLVHQLQSTSSASPQKDR